MLLRDSTLLLIPYRACNLHSKVNSKFIAPLLLVFLCLGAVIYFEDFSFRMAANSKLSRMTGEDEQYTFCWKLFTTWDYMIGLAETAKNKMAEIVTIFKVKTLINNFGIVLNT